MAQEVMYFDCFSGAAGDMILAALVDAGVPADALRGALGSLGVDHELSIERVVRAGISATYVSVHARAAGGDRPQPHRHDHVHHHHGHESHRSLDEIAHLIGHSALSAAGRERAVAMFRRLAEAEAAIHNMPVEEVHLHEVGAVDSIIDIVGAVFAMEWFGIDDVVASPLNVGGGTVQMAHGTYPVPAPATLRLLDGVPIYSSGPQTELVTPTGALILTAYARSFGGLPPMAVRTVGYGAGTKDFSGRPNVVRVAIGTRVESETARPSVVQIECEIDDMNPQLFGPVTDRLFAAGALDVFLTPVQMKKGRPGTLVTVLADAARREAICSVLFRETTTIGVRFTDVARETLDRRMEPVEIAGGVVRMKIASRRGEVLNAVPEFDDCVRVADATGVPVKRVQAEALRAWLARNSP